MGPTRKRVGPSGAYEVRPLMLRRVASGSPVSAGVGGHAVEGRDEARVGVLLVLAGPVQVGEEADGPRPGWVDGGDHDVRRAISCAVAS